MSHYIPAHESIDAAWADALEVTNSRTGGRALDLILTVDNPAAGVEPDVQSVVDEALAMADRPLVQTVANTLFPAELYNAPGFSWSADLPEAQQQLLKDAREDLYEAYLTSLPGIRMFHRNRMGTYFSRFITWPGKEAGGVNQLELRIESMQGRRNFHASDLAVAGEGEFGLQMYAATDRRYRDFPCLSHVNLSLSDGRLSMSAVYRNWHLISRGYGNLVGLSRLQAFLAQQTGVVPGELVVLAGQADAERDIYGGIPGVSGLLAQVRAARRPASAVTS